ncbi:MAG: thioredoxin [Phycisphaerae bacterium]|nr:thioredoxin [Gemmatimonadaceae bacterium]
MAETTTGPSSTAAGSHNNSVVVRCTTCSTLNRINLSRIADRPRCSRCANALPLDRPLAASDADFQKFLDGARVPVLVDFYADWCGPCKAMAPALESFARQHAGNVLVLKLDTDANPSTSRRFNIASIPTLIVFRNGVEAKRQTGAVPRAVLDSMLA